MFDSLIGRLPQEVAPEEVACLYKAVIEKVRKFRPRESSRRFYRDRVGEPRGVGPIGRPRKSEKFWPFREPFGPSAKIFFSSFNEERELLHLLRADGGLHVCDLQVIADMRIDIFMVVTFRQIPILRGKSFPTSIVLASSAIAIATPVADGSSGASQYFVVGEDATAFPHRYVVSRVERAGGYMAERADELPFILRAQMRRSSLQLAKDRAFLLVP